MEISPPLRAWTARARETVTPNISTAPIIAAATVCPYCEKPIGLIIGQGRSEYPHALYGHAGGGPNAVDGIWSGFHVELFPEDVGLATFPNLPQLIAENFKFAQEDAARRRNPAGIMSQARGCLDVALKELGESTGGRRNRIQNLADRGIVTKAIADWAQNLWEEGSDAAHDLTATIDRAVEHIAFLKLFFEVAFELPAKIATQPHAPSEHSG